jgi:beta-lactamase regulating signal transducer with metallopeptidase domain
VVISRELAKTLDAGELRAVEEHEAAHARHRDPLRILCMQFLADLQWPIPATTQRLVAWRRALEIARDEEARARGVDGDDLASAILKTVRIAGASRVSHSGCGLIEPGDLKDRIQRLLHPLPRAPRRRIVFLPFVAVAVVAAALVGSTFGEAAVRALPGVVSDPTAPRDAT